MNVAQNWTIIGFMAAALTGLVTAMFWLVSVQGSRITEGFTSLRNEVHSSVDGLRNEVHAGVDGLRNEVHAGVDGLRNEFNVSVYGVRSEVHASFNGLRNEVHASFTGLRNEMNTRFDHLETRLERVEKIDREVHALTLKVFGDDPPRSP
jgi:hypothetical protein